MSRTVLFTLSGVLGLGVLLSTTLTSTEDYRHSQDSHVAVTVQNQQVADELTEMTLARMESILASEFTNLEGGGGQWRAQIDGRSVIVLADPANNRMRVVSPVVAASSLTEEQVWAMLLANYHSALDARYSISDGAVVSVFVHPLTTLQETDFRSGLRQVATLAETFGSSYSSGVLGFLPNGQPRQAPAGGIQI